MQRSIKRKCIKWNVWCLWVSAKIWMNFRGEASGVPCCFCIATKLRQCLDAVCTASIETSPISNIGSFCAVLISLGKLTKNNVYIVLQRMVVVHLPYAVGLPQLLVVYLLGGVLLLVYMITLPLWAYMTQGDNNLLSPAFIL
jgi:hypothetical protein